MYYRGERYVTGHSLLELGSSLESTHPEISGHRKILQKLDRYYVHTRYSDALGEGVPFEVYDDQEDAREAAEGAGAIVAAAKGVIESQ